MCLWTLNLRDWPAGFQPFGSRRRRDTFSSAPYSSSARTTRVGFFSAGFLRPLSGFRSSNNRPCSSLDLSAAGRPRAIVWPPGTTARAGPRFPPPLGAEFARDGHRPVADPNSVRDPRERLPNTPRGPRHGAVVVGAAGGILTATSWARYRDHVRPAWRSSSPENSKRRPHKEDPMRRRYPRCSATAA